MAHIQIRIHNDDKKAAKAVLDRLGLTFSGAIKLFLKQLVIQQRLPFTISVEEVQMAETDQGETPAFESETEEEKPKFKNLLGGFSARKIGE